MAKTVSQTQRGHAPKHSLHYQIPISLSTSLGGNVPHVLVLIICLHQHYFSANPTFVPTISLYQWLFGTIYFLVPLVVAGHRHQDVAP